MFIDPGLKKDPPDDSGQHIFKNMKISAYHKKDPRTKIAVTAASERVIVRMVCASLMNSFPDHKKFRI